jgi:hypothetical protein
MEIIGKLWLCYHALKTIEIERKDRGAMCPCCTSLDGKHTANCMANNALQWVEEFRTEKREG